MKVGKLFCTALVAGALAVTGCGSDDGGSGNGNGNGNGNGGSDPCNTGECATDPAKKELCDTQVDTVCRLFPDFDACVDSAIADFCS